MFNFKFEANETKFSKKENLSKVQTQLVDKNSDSDNELEILLLITLNLQF